MRSSFLLALAGFTALLGWAPMAIAGSVDSKTERAAWKDDWNARIDAHEKRRDHPCGDFAFDPWADAFLAGCEGREGPKQAKAVLQETLGLGLAALSAVQRLAGVAPAKPPEA